MRSSLLPGLLERAGARTRRRREAAAGAARFRGGPGVPPRQRTGFACAPASALSTRWRTGDRPAPWGRRRASGRTCSTSRATSRPASTRRAPPRWPVRIPASCAHPGRSATRAGRRDRAGRRAAAAQVRPRRVQPFRPGAPDRRVASWNLRPAGAARPGRCAARSQPACRCVAADLALMVDEAARRGRVWTLDVSAGVPAVEAIRPFDVLSAAASGRRMAGKALARFWCCAQDTARTLTRRLPRSARRWMHWSACWRRSRAASSARLLRRRRVHDDADQAAELRQILLLEQLGPQQARGEGHGRGASSRRSAWRSRRARASSCPASAISSCATSRSGPAAIPRPARRFRSPRGAW